MQTKSIERHRPLPDTAEGGAMKPFPNYSFLAKAAAEARAESRRHWAPGGEAARRHPVHEEARFWPLQKPRDPDGVLFINARGVRVLCAILELLEFRDIEAVRSLIDREIVRVPECP